MLSSKIFYWVEIVKKGKGPSNIVVDFSS